jgi:hypothetical protein
MRNKIIAGAAVGALATLGFAVPAQAISATSADLYVLHAVPDATVDVYVNGALTLDDFEPGDLAGPLDLPAGTYTVAITAFNAPDASSPIIPAFDLPLAAGKSYTAVAHLDASDSITASLFENDLSETAAGEGRLTVRHTAAAPLVDILAGDSPVVEDLANGDQATLDLGVGTVSAAVAPAGTTTPVIGPADVAIQDGVLTIVYAWGSLEEDNLQLAVQTISGLHSTPDGVNSGEAGLAADQNPMVAAAGIAGLAALAALALLGVARVRAAKSNA